MGMTGSGFDGTLTEAAFARLMNGQGLPGPWPPSTLTDELKVTLSTTSLEAYVGPTTSLTSGGGYVARSIVVSNDASTTVTFTNPSSGDRYDAVCLLLDWTPTGGTVTPVVVQGTSAKDLPTAAMEATDGYKVHVPLALVKLTAGSVTPTGITDWRVGAGWKVEGTSFLTSPGSGLQVNSGCGAVRTRGGTVTVHLDMTLTSALSSGSTLQKVSIRDPFGNGMPFSADGQHSNGGFVGVAQIWVDPRDSTGLSDIWIRAGENLTSGTSLRTTISYAAVGAV